MSDAAAGIEALAGRLKLHIVGGDARFSVMSAAGEGLKVAEVRPTGATIGRGEDTDHRLQGASAKGVSRRHLLVQPAGRQWTVLDFSKNGTREAVEVDGIRKWRRLPQDLPVPVTANMRLTLGAGIELDLEIIQSPGQGSTTATSDEAVLRVDNERIPIDELERTAHELLAPRRRGSASIPRAEELAEALNVSRATLYRRIDLLAKLPQVEPLLGGKARSGRGPRRPQDVADALVIAFPYLTAPTSPP